MKYILKTYLVSFTTASRIFPEIGRMCWLAVLPDRIEW